MICKIENCGKSAWAKGLCSMHLRRLRIHGDVNYVSPTRTPEGEKLKWLIEAIKIETDDCVNWPFKVGNHGYGFLTYDEETKLSHHVVLILHNRSLPVDLEETRHLCNNKLCVNNRHLMVGDPADNAQDRAEAGVLKGIRNGHAKLTEEEVKYIKGLPNYRGINTRLSEQFNVSRSLISSIRRNERWKHV